MSPRNAQHGAGRRALLGAVGRGQPCLPDAPSRQCGAQTTESRCPVGTSRVGKSEGQPRAVPAEERVAGVLERLQHGRGRRPDQVAAVERGLPRGLEPPVHLFQVSAHLVPPEPAHDGVDRPQLPAAPPRQRAPPGLGRVRGRVSTARPRPARQIPPPAGSGSPSAPPTACGCPQVTCPWLPGTTSTWPYPNLCPTLGKELLT